MTYKPYTDLTDTQLQDAWEKETNHNWASGIIFWSLWLALTWILLRLAFWISLAIALILFTLTAISMIGRKSKKTLLEEEINRRKNRSY